MSYTSYLLTVTLPAIPLIKTAYRRSQFLTAEKIASMHERKMCVSRHWQRNFFFFFFFFAGTGGDGGGGGGGGLRAMKSSAVSFVLFLYLLNISYYIFCVSLSDLRSKKTCFQIYLFRIYFANE